MSYDYVKIADFCHLVSRGKTPKYDDNGSGKVVKSAHVQIENIRWENCPNVSDEFVLKYKDKFRLRKRDVLLNGTGTGTLGRPGCVNEEPDGIFILDSHVNLFRVKESKLFYRFLFYWLLAPQCQREIERSHTGSTNQIELSAIRAGNLSIPLPPLEEQKRIAAILDKADRIRRKRQEAIRLTEELGRSIFLDMFGDPVSNPKGWEVASLSEFGEVLTGNTPPRADLENYGDCIEWIKSDNITTPYHFLTEASEKLSSIGKKKGRVVPPGSILVCCIAGSKSSIGRAAIADREVAFNQQINAIVPNKSVETYFLYSQFLVAQSLVQSESTDSMKGLVNKSKFSGIQFLKPPLSKQVEFRDKFLKFIDINKKLAVSLCESENLFNSLLQKAFRGEL